jgi:hypothetical protein
MGILENKLVKRPVWRGKTDQIKNIIWKKVSQGRKPMIAKKKVGKFGFEKRRSLGETIKFIRTKGDEESEHKIVGHRGEHLGTISRGWLRRGGNQWVVHRPDKSSRGYPSLKRAKQAMMKEDGQPINYGSGSKVSVGSGSLKAKDPVLRKKIYKVIRMAEADLIGKKTPSVEEIAKKHNVSVDQIQAQIVKGVAIEKEHTNDENEANEIARDHLHEFPDYYDKLKKMEKGMKNESKLGLAIKQSKEGSYHDGVLATHWLYYNGRPLTGIRGSRFDSEETIKQKALDMHKRTPLRHPDMNPGEMKNAIKLSIRKIQEDAPAMSVGAGVIAGMPSADPPEKTAVRRKKFAGKTVFVVDPTTYHKAHLGKRKYEHYEKYLEGCDIAEEIRAYGRKYWAEPIIIQNEQTGAMVYLKYGSK